MKFLVVALRNVWLHRYASLLVFAVLTVSSFVLFWAFGYTNLVGRYVYQMNRDSYGDVSLFTDFFPTEKGAQLLREDGFETVVFEREIRAVIDSPHKSSLVVLVEITNENLDRLLPYVRPIAGRLPRQADEIMISEFFERDVYHLGDTLFVTANTARQVVNTIQYKVVGIAKSSAVKAGTGNGFMISKSGMDALLANSDSANLAYVYFAETLPPKDPQAVAAQLSARFEKSGIPVKKVWNVNDRTAALKSFDVVLAGVKTIVLLILFPLIGAVVGAMVWMHLFRRRQEIWTYQALGMKDRAVFGLVALEYWALVGLGLAIGTSAGHFTAQLAKGKNIWFQFAYTFVSPLRVLMSGYDVFLIGLFLFATVALWTLFPLGKIIHAKPFSY